MSGLTIQQILQAGATSYLAKRRVRLEVYRAISKLMHCRTEDMGYHLRRCPNGHVQQLYYNA